MTCGNNTLVINRPNSQGMASMSCASSCSSGGDGNSCSRPGIGPRKQREKVKEAIREYIIFMLGGPTLPLELDEQAVDFCINQALMIVENYAPREYFSWYTFGTIPGKSVYEMPPDVGYVRRVEYKNFGQFAFNASELGGQIPLEYFYSGSSISDGLMNPIQPIWGRAGEWVLYKQYETMFSKVSSQLGGWEWVGGFRDIKLYPTPSFQTKVAVQYLQKCKDWEEVTQSMQEGALSYAKEIVGRIRSRIKNPPGPGGGVQLDGDTLLAEAKVERDKWKEELIYKFGDGLSISFG